MKVRVPNIFKELNLTDRQLILIELLYNLHKSYTGKWWFAINPQDIKVILKPDTAKHKLIVPSNLTKLYHGLVDFVEISDDQWLIRIGGRRPNSLPCYEHELTDVNAIKLYCYLLGRLASGIIEDEFAVDTKDKRIHVSGKRGQSVITPYQREQLNA